MTPALLARAAARACPAKRASRIPPQPIICASTSFLYKKSTGIFYILERFNEGHCYLWIFLYKLLSSPDNYPLLGKAWLVMGNNNFFGFLRCRIYVFIFYYIIIISVNAQNLNTLEWEIRFARQDKFVRRRRSGF